MLGDRIYCGQCMKCFRKTKLNNLNFEKIELNKLGIYKKKKEILKIINNYPIKMATSTIYTCQKSNYKKSPIINIFNKLDVSFIVLS